MKSILFLMIFIIFFGCTPSPKDIKNETMTNKTNETIENKTGDSMAKTENEEIIEVMIREYESASIFENWTVKVNGIFMHSGKIKAELDVSGGFDELLKDTPSMPLYIGHERSDEVIVGHGRDYYLKEIKKFGKDNPGYVVISTEKPTEESKICQEEVSIEETTVGNVGGTRIGIAGIWDTDGKISVQMSFSGVNYVAFENDTIWVGECAYNVEKISKGDENGYILLKRLEVTDMVEKKGEEPEGKKTTIKGIANRVKVGLEVGGVFLVSLPDADKYVGKLVEVTGYVIENQDLVVEPYEKGKPISQGFQSAPSVMRDIVSIKIIKK